MITQFHDLKHSDSGLAAMCKAQWVQCGGCPSLSVLCAYAYSINIARISLRICVGHTILSSSQALHVGQDQYIIVFNPKQVDRLVSEVEFQPP